MVRRSALVTGATGFVGRHLTTRLVEDGWLVRTIARSSFIHTGVEHIEADLTKLSDFGPLLETIDTVFHCAAWLPGRGDRARARPLNVDVTRDLAMAAAAMGARRFVHLSSTAAMGNTDVSPADESTRCNPSSLYEVTKHQSELALNAIHSEIGLATVILRPPMIAGPGLHDGPLVSMIKLMKRGVFPIFGGRRDMAKPLVHVEDLIEAMLRASTKDVSGGTFIITCGVSHTIGDIVDHVAHELKLHRPTVNIPGTIASLAAWVSTPLFAALGRESPLSKARLRMYRANREFDITRAQLELGFSPKFTKLSKLLKPVLTPCP